MLRGLFCHIHRSLLTLDTSAYLSAANQHATTAGCRRCVATARLVLARPRYRTPATQAGPATQPPHSPDFAGRVSTPNNYLMGRRFILFFISYFILICLIFCVLAEQLPDGEKKFSSRWRRILELRTTIFLASGLRVGREARMHKYVCIYVCMYVCMYVCVCVCVDIYIYVHVH